MAISLPLKAQDEGKITKRERIERDKSIFIGGGVSSSNALADYSVGVNFEAGFSKRINRIVSLGGSLSYLNFAYDQKIAPGASVIDPLKISSFPSNFYYSSASLTDPTFINVGGLLFVSGSNISLFSLALNLKVNFVPIKDNTKISVYGFAKPFVSRATSSSGSVTLDGVFVNNQFKLTRVNTPDSKTNIPFDSQSVITGGIFIGPGLEILPNNPISFFLQATFGYTFPLDESSIKTLPRDIDKWPTSIPVKSTGFTSVNFVGGISINID
jgi:hypothetical protein